MKSFFGERRNNIIPLLVREIADLKNRVYIPLDSEYFRWGRMFNFEVNLNYLQAS